MNDAKKKLTYTNEEGQEVFTSTYLLNRGTCCKTNCLHCPYGHTTKSFSIEIIPMEKKHIRLANEIINEARPVELSALAQSILALGFGKKDKVKSHDVTEDNLAEYALGQFKNVICAVIEFSKKLSESNSGRGVKELYLKKEFQGQGLGIEHIKN